MKVAKFGGSSLANAEQIKKVCNIIIEDSERQIVVVSAPGKRHCDDIKVTDLLILCAKAMLNNGSAENELQSVVDRFKNISDDLNIESDIIERIKTDLTVKLDGDTSDPAKFIDCMKAAGEDNCAKLLAEYLCSIGQDAIYINPGIAGLYLTSEYGNARVLPESYDSLASLKDLPGIKIFPGFFGYSKTGEIVTFSRGGSDVTGSILSSAVNADLYENFTDVDGVYAVNPKLVKDPVPIKEMTYREMRELSYAGFSVFHEEALSPVYKKGIPVCVKNTNNPTAPGTTIVRELNDNKHRPVIGVAGDDGFLSIFISKYLMNREVGFGRRMLQIFENEGISYEHTPSGIDDISVIIREKFLKDPQKEKRLLKTLKRELQADNVTIKKGEALLMIVGEGCRHSIGVSAKATKALADANINIEMINQGSSEVSIMFGVSAENCDKGVQALYHAFFN